jgi:hypothetical protein
MAWMIVGRTPKQTVAGTHSVYLSFSEDRGWYWSPYKGGSVAYIEGEAEGAIETARRCVKPWYCRPLVDKLTPIFQHQGASTADM